MTIRQPPSLAAVAVLAGTATATPATPATADASPRSSSAKTIDDAGYSGPRPDNWEITVQVGSRRPARRRATR